MLARALRTIVVSAVAAGAALIGVVLAASPAGALATSTLGITPVSEADFHLDRVPDESADRQTVVINPPTRPTTSSVYPVDATVTQGGFAHLRLVPLPWPSGLLELALVVFATWRFARFLRKARAALRQAGPAVPTIDRPAMTAKGGPR